MSGRPSTQETYTEIQLTIWIFRGSPWDTYNRRHVILQFTSSENREFNESIHAQRQDINSPWNVDRIRNSRDWALSKTYINHVQAGAMTVRTGEEMLPVQIAGSVPVKDRESDWNCQNFILEGLQKMVNHKLQTQEWYDWVENDLMDKLLDGASE